MLKQLCFCTSCVVWVLLSNKLTSLVTGMLVAMLPPASVLFLGFLSAPKVVTITVQHHQPHLLPVSIVSVCCCCRSMVIDTSKHKTLAMAIVSTVRTTNRFSGATTALKCSLKNSQLVKHRQPFHSFVSSFLHLNFLHFFTVCFFCYTFSTSVILFITRKKSLPRPKC